MPATSIIGTTELRLDPKLKRKMQVELKAYAAIKVQEKAIKHALAKRAAAIDILRDEAGVMKLSLDGFSVTLVGGVRKKFNAKTFVAEGGDLLVYKNSFDEVPIKSYTKITVPGTKDEEDE